MDGTTIFLPVTLAAAAAAALINLWLAIRVGQMRGQTKLVHGDDAGGPLTGECARSSISWRTPVSCWC